jgi:Glycosyl hydrolase catalytic core
MRNMKVATYWTVFCSAIMAITPMPLRAGDVVNGQPIRVVNCDEKVQSHKRGVCANQLNAEDFKALAPGVSWWYTWFYQPSDVPPVGVPMHFLPMAWGDRPGDVSGLDKYLASGKKPEYVLAINEPNLKGQAFIPPQQAANLYARIKSVADKYGIPVVGPQMALGSGTNASIRAMDPIENKEVTYTFMVPYLKAFDFYAKDTPTTAVSLHTYGAVEELRWAVGAMHKQFDKPVWVTEFAFWKARDEAAEIRYAMKAVDFLERSPDVAGYAWFKERVGENKKISLLEKEPGKLSPVGQVYVSMPVHDADVYYRIPGKLPAGNYVTIDKADVEPATDHAVLLDLQTGDADATVDYNLQVDTAGSYDVTLHISGTPGKIDIMKGDQTLASVQPADKTWQDTTATIDLPEGPQTLRLHLGEKGQLIESLNFAAHHP